MINHPFPECPRNTIDVDKKFNSFENPAHSRRRRRFLLRRRRRRTYIGNRPELYPNRPPPSSIASSPQAVIAGRPLRTTSNGASHRPQKSDRRHSHLLLFDPPPPILFTLFGDRRSPLPSQPLGSLPPVRSYASLVGAASQLGSSSLQFAPRLALRRRAPQALRHRFRLHA